MAAVANTPTVGAGAVSKLRHGMHGDVLLPGDGGYETARRVWNGMIDRRPGAIARCCGAADVVAAVEVAREHGLLVAVRGGGHNVAGTGVCDGGLMIDLSQMKGMRVDPKRRVAHAQPGLTWGEFDRETQLHGLATTGGLVSSTGIAGFTLGGGLGWLMRQHGLACDNLRSFDLITADGSRVTANDDENADLFWGVRGGGGNFGVVTSFELALHPHTTVFAGVVLHPFAVAREALAFFRDFAAQAPDEVTVHAGLLSTPDGQRMAAFLACYAVEGDDLSGGEAALSPLREWGSPIADTVEVRPYVAWQSMFDEANRDGRRNYWKSNVLRHLDDGAIDAIVERFPLVPSVSSTVVIEGLGGQVARVGEGETAYTHRDAGFDFLISSIWDDPAEDEVNIGWTRDSFVALEPFVRGSVYVNYLGNEGEDRVREAYGPEKHARLVELKNRYDPGNLFRLNQNIRPTSTT